MSDGPNSLRLEDFEDLLKILKRVDTLIKEGAGASES